MERRNAVKRRTPELSASEQSEASLEEDELDLLSAGRSFGEAKEFMRASHLLRDCQSARGRFMRWYYDYLVSLLLLFNLYPILHPCWRLYRPLAPLGFPWPQQGAAHRLFRPDDGGLWISGNRHSR